MVEYLSDDELYILASIAYDLLTTNDLILTYKKNSGEVVYNSDYDTVEILIKQGYIVAKIPKNNTDEYYNFNLTPLGYKVFQSLDKIELLKSRCLEDSFLIDCIIQELEIKDLPELLVSDNKSVRDAAKKRCGGNIYQPATNR
jgi:hypothetical protein